MELIVFWIFAGFIGTVWRGYQMNELDNIIQLMAGTALGPITLFSAFVYFITR